MAYDTSSLDRGYCVAAAPGVPRRRRLRRARQRQQPHFRGKSSTRDANDASDASDAGDGAAAASWRGALRGLKAALDPENVMDARNGLFWDGDDGEAAGPLSSAPFSRSDIK